VCASEFIDSDTYVSSDNDFNISIFQKYIDNSDISDIRLNTISKINYADHINKFSYGSIVLSKYYQNEISKSLIFGTIGGINKINI
jgi:hypothetical protein